MSSIKERFLISSSDTFRDEFIKSIHNENCEYIVIYGKSEPVLPFKAVKIKCSRLMEDDVFLLNLGKMKSNTVILLFDVLNKNAVYAHPYGRIYKFCESAKEVYVIDSFGFKFDEKQIFRPFLFIDPNILGSSLISFFASENKIEDVIETIEPYIKTDFRTYQIKTIEYQPTVEELSEYSKLKTDLVGNEENNLTKIVSKLIDFVNQTKSKINAISSSYFSHGSSLIYSDNKPKNKFHLFDELHKKPNINEVVFLSSCGKFGADELQLEPTREALRRHNTFINLLKAMKNGKDV